MKDKTQNKDQQKQVDHAISIFYEIRRPNSNKKGNIEARTINKRLPPPNTIEKLLTKADWTSVYNALGAEIKIRHYSPTSHLPAMPSPKQKKASSVWLIKFPVN